MPSKEYACQARISKLNQLLGETRMGKAKCTMAGWNIRCGCGVVGGLWGVWGGGGSGGSDGSGGAGTSGETKRR